MTQRSIANPPARSLFFNLRFALGAGFTLAALAAVSLGAQAQAPSDSAAPAQAAQAAAAQTGQPAAAPAKTHAQKAGKNENKVVASKDTRQEVKKDSQIASMDVNLPDKELYDKAEDAIKHGRFDVARLDLQTLLDTYQSSQYLMRAKLAIADSWYKEGGTAALTEAEQEYKDFITFFPNAPEAAEAQMRVGDIYFRQMDKPDRDDTTTVKAEQEYRLMLQQFPDSVLVPQARNRLRAVQEMLAARDVSVAAFYATKQPPNLPGAIARYQTVVDTYPQYSHMDEVLIALGDVYETEAKSIASILKVAPNASAADKARIESARTRLVSLYDEDAANCYRKVVLEHSAAPHAEDARDRLVSMNLPVPTPTPEQVAASTALENSRGQYTLSKRAVAIFLRQADTVLAATTGDPPLEDAKPTLAPDIVRRAHDDFVAAMNNTAPAAAVDAPATAVTKDASVVAPAPAPAAASTPASSAPLSFQDVPTATAPVSTSAVETSVPSAASAGGASGTGVGLEIVQPSGSSQAPVTPSATPPAFPGTAAPANAAPADDYGLKPAASANAAPLPPIEKPAPAPDVINDAAGQNLPAAQAPPADGKKAKPACDKSDESCSNHKKKKGLGKLNPF